ncbi:DUF4124 domain-containing protein [Ramlibacter rhizophilus]|uniref:DUF4124 domain-containing protein n=1 Tax=Ramlibacter rhizophilus TaxID=1781167 RepID=A0A4Z0BAZ0_9BURK|nr:DUF4124 domain-containing protein [Ramlibacter rhizophilus]TFY96242.1 DUF4124 domain-containing protein [Ramlibacter rhizophilus]
MRSPTSAALITAAVLGAANTAGAQQIFSCVDAQGRTLTSDRPILECIDREQRVLSPNGTVKRRLPPSYTAPERAALEAKARAEAEERQRQADERQRQRALLVRFPNPESLDQERLATLARVDGIIASARERIAALAADRRRLEAEANAKAGERARVPGSLQYALEENERQLGAQQRFLASQQQEHQRLQQQFEQMRSQLLALWRQPGASTD